MELSLSWTNPSMYRWVEDIYGLVQDWVAPVQWSYCSLALNHWNYDYSYLNKGIADAVTDFIIITMSPVTWRPILGALSWCPMLLSQVTAIYLKIWVSTELSLTYPIVWWPEASKPPVGQVDLNKVLFCILCKQIEKMHNSIEVGQVENFGYVKPWSIWEFDGYLVLKWVAVTWQDERVPGE